MRTNTRPLTDIVRAGPLLLSLVSGASCAPRLKDAPAPVGQWRVVRSFEGNSEVKEQLPTLILTADGRYESRDQRDELVAQGTFLTDPAAVPAEIEIVPEKPSSPADTKRLGIYRVAGDRLTLVISLNGRRPTAFAPVDDPLVMFTVFERKK